MAEDFGFAPCNEPGYYFVSYNSEDAERVGAIARKLHSNNVLLWYDKGIPYGEKWEAIIAEKIKKSQAVILFFTKGILFKEDSYVKKEYRIATKNFKKKVYVIMLDFIDDESVPLDKVFWFNDIRDNHNIDIVDINDLDKISNEIMSAIDIKNSRKMQIQAIDNKKEKENPFLAEIRKIAESKKEEQKHAKTDTPDVSSITPPACPTPPSAPSVTEDFDDDQFYVMINEIINDKKNIQNSGPISSEGYIPTTGSKEIEEFSIKIDEIIQARERKVKEMFAVEDSNYGKPVPVSCSHNNPKTVNTNNETEIKSRRIPVAPGSPTIPSFGEITKASEEVTPKTTDSSFDDDQFYIMLNEIINGKQ